MLMWVTMKKKIKRKHSYKDCKQQNIYQSVTACQML